MLKQKRPPTIKEVLGEGWFKGVALHTGVKDSGTLSRLVNLEYHTSKHWPAVLEYAQKVNPAGFATWAAANPDKVPAVAQAA
jgi:hypothetical protein